MSKPVDPTDIDHIAANKPVYLLPTLATVQAAMTTSTNELEFEKAYTLTATIDSKASESALVDPQMVVSVPAGQRYTAGTAKVEYPVGTFTAVSPEVEAKLVEVLAADATQNATRDYTMIVKDLIGENVLHGFGDNTVTDADRVVSLVMEFKSMCETPLTGIRFEGAPSGKNLCDVLANGSEKRERSVEMFSTLDAEYEFSVNLAMVSGNRAFNEIRKEDKLKIDITKSKGNDALLAGDALYLYFPKYLNIKDASSVVINSTNIPEIDGTTATIVSNTEIGGERVIAIQLPVAAINASSADHGLGKGLSFTADVVYTPNRDDLELVGNPVQTIKTIITTNKQFSPSCPDAPLAIGSANLDVALITASENPYKGEVGTPLTLEIISSEYAGEWFDVETGGTALSSEATYTFTPADANDKTFYVSSVFNGVDYGRVPVLVSSVPILDFTVVNPDPLCVDSELDLATLVSGYAEGVTIKYYSDAALTTEITNPKVIVKTKTSYFVVATNGTSVSEPKEIVIDVLALTVITTQPVASKVNFDGTITLSVVAAGENLTYQWQKDGVNIAGATAATYSKASAKDGDNGVYAVIVSGDCGSITSVNAQVTVYPSLELVVTKPTAICQGETIDLSQFVTTKPGVTVKYYSDADGRYELVNRNVKPNASTIYYVRGVNAAGVQGTLYRIVVDVNPLPEAKIVSSSDIVCANTEGEITLNLTGTAPWNIVYSDGTKDYTVTATTSDYTFKVPVAQETTYTLKSVTDALACGDGKVSGSTTIKVEEPVVIIKQPTSVAFCNGDGFTLEVEASGAVDYQWYKDGKALNGENGASLYVSLAEKADNGEYSVEVIGNCGSVESNKVKVQVNLSDIIVQKWNNTLVANNNASTNGGYNFVSYKWFKEGVQIDKGPYHTVGNNPNDMLDMGAAYTLEITTDKGEVFMTCPFYPSLKHASVRLYPNPAKVGEPVYIEVTTEDGATPNGTVDMYTLGGITLTPKKVTEKVTQVSFSNPGVYIVKYKAGEFNQDFKVIVK